MAFVRLAGRYNSGQTVHLLLAEELSAGGQTAKNLVVSCRCGGNVKPVRSIQFLGTDLNMVNCKTCRKVVERIMQAEGK